jgi:hypothetical protein
MFDQGGVGCKEGTGLKPEPLDAQPRDFCHHLVQGLVAVPQMVVKGDSHPV